MTLYSSIEDAVKDIKLGKMVIAVDDESRENEGDLIMAAEKVTAQDINFMATNGRGLICTPLAQELADRFELDLMVKNNQCANQTAFTVTIDLKKGGSGISCEDRANTILELTKDDATALSFSRPGHVFPLIAKDNGVLEREGHTEAAVDLMRISGFRPVAVICEILNCDGSVSRGEQLVEFAKTHDIKIIKICDLINYRKNIL